MQLYEELYEELYVKLSDYPFAASGSIDNARDVFENYMNGRCSYDDTGYDQ